jgi:hypothetical protein
LDQLLSGRLAMSETAPPCEQTRTATDAQEDDFSLLTGGPLFQLSRRMGLVDEALSGLRARIAIVVGLTWAPLVALTLAEGSLIHPSPEVSFLGDIECQARFLVTVPLLMFAEQVVHGRLRPLVAQFRARRIVRPEGLARYAAAVRRAHRLRNSALAEALLLAAVFVTSFVSARYRYTELFPTSWYTRPGEQALSMAGTWFVFVSLPVFQFLLARWYFRLVIWTVFLCRVARLPLKLEPLHPDKAGGLGFLGSSLIAFVPLAAAHGVIVSGVLADQILYSGAKLNDFKLVIAGAGAVLLTAFAGPLLIFGPALSRARRGGLLQYGRVANNYTEAFWAKWIASSGPDDEALLGSGDIQSLADLGNSYAVVEQMRIVPLTRAGVMRFLFAFLAPIAPLMLTVMSLEAFARTLIKMVL